jgi:HD-GYP domain-containing protein (c-di-GMP phosphodiesterase class II)
VSDIKLQYPIHTLDNQQLLFAGTILSDKVMHGLMSTESALSRKVFPLMRHGTIRHDLFYFMNELPYSTIFSLQDRTDQALGLMEKVGLPHAVLEILDHFKDQNPYTYRHLLMVYMLSIFLTQELLTDFEDLLCEANVGPTHDLGKICVPLRILNKRTPLTSSEHNMLEHHVAAGYVLLGFYLRDTKNLAAIVARDHHERRDGSGYPLGIQLQNRMVEIVVASDIYDALLSPRPYRSAPYDNRTALEELTSMAQRGDLALEIVQALVAHNRKRRTHYSECKIATEKRGCPPSGNSYGIIAPDGGGSDC